MSILLKSLIVFLTVQVAIVALNFALPPDMSKAQKASAVALDRNGVWLRALPVDDGRWRIRADLQRTDKSFVRHLLTVEDERFYLHHGVDPLALIRAFSSNMQAGSVVSGGSTLTMQTARLLSPKDRTYLSKLIEVVRAVQLEACYTKREILSIYLTLAPYGGNLEGVRAASLSYFGHEPESLTIGEQALLIALPQAPEARRPDRNPKAALYARNEVLLRLQDKGAITPAVAQEAMEEPLVTRRAAFPALAWHAAGRLARQVRGLEATVITTIDAPLQSRLEALARQTAVAQGLNSSAAIMVVDIKTRAVRASVGSAGLDRAGGWIDMMQRVRSPGSSLKPFIYGIGFEDGVIAPETRLMDVPTRFGDYQPENFDRVFHGEVSAKDALVNSLNVPAVAVLNRIGAEGFSSRLEGAGIHLIRPKAGLKDAGLALALGGAGIKLSDLASLYAALGDNGVVKPLAWTETEAKVRPYQPGSRLMTQDAAQKTLAILRETPAPAGRLPGALMKSANRPAYKTGTSYGYRDALAVGVAGGHAILVWTGRPDGGARADMTGRDAAAPLLFDVVDQLQAPAQLPNVLTPDRPPEALKEMKTVSAGPVILFPPDGSTVFVEVRARAGDGDFTLKRGLKLSARGKGLQWYVNGEALPKADGAPLWYPAQEGFYDVAVVDGEDRARHVKVRVKAVD
ncbi:penicillin-binding protein 1C [Asticcacaulis sp. ZE23SCel15]|uniref:penicillin-binding protein 1C n=1 Tax=Asticcacaulis sp. ZE23SCel15 TaxID=3059027 RepID=UPI00265EF530|nr:penicillin-binding protein 1C [Asticcacaulis sp. ZE23SCel15]WKL58509.1 penicillin-binding protein 1C [Asticcacaulis sp. ZE23SCel15]